MSLGKRLDACLCRMSFFAEGATVDFQKDRIDTGKSTSSPPTNHRPLSLEWADRAERMVLAMERDAENHARGASVVPRVTAGDLRKRIHSYEGRDVVFVAYTESCSTELVRKVRVTAGLDAITGFRRPPSLTSRVLPEDV